MTPKPAQGEMFWYFSRCWVFNIRAFFFCFRSVTESPGISTGLQAIPNTNVSCEILDQSESMESLVVQFASNFSSLTENFGVPCTQCQSFKTGCGTIELYPWRPWVCIGIPKKDPKRPLFLPVKSSDLLGKSNWENTVVFFSSSHLGATFVAKEVLFSFTSFPLATYDLWWSKASTG